MPRPKEYDREDVLRRAMERFWDHGYHATGVSDLEAVMGINKFSIYAAFGSKRGVLLESLDLYARTWQAQTFARLDPADPAGSILWLFSFASDLPARIGHNGCFLLAMGQEFNHSDPEITRRIDSMYSGLEARLVACLEALGAEASPLAVDACQGGAFLRTLLEGVLASSRHGGTGGCPNLEAPLARLLGQNPSRMGRRDRGTARKANSARPRSTDRG